MAPPAGGTVKVPSTVPVVDWVLILPGESDKGWDCGSLHLHLTSSMGRLYYNLDTFVQYCPLLCPLLGCFEGGLLGTMKWRRVVQDE